MKTLFSFLALMALVVTSSFTVTTQEQTNAAQTFSCFNYIRVHKQGKNDASLSWAVSNPQIAYFIVERSYDGEFFDQAATVASSNSSMYKHIDKGLYPGYIHFRVLAVYPDGSSEYSPVETLRIVQRK